MFFNAVASIFIRFAWFFPRSLRSLFENQFPVIEYKTIIPKNETPINIRYAPKAFLMNLAFKLYFIQTFLLLVN